MPQAPNDIGTRLLQLLGADTAQGIRPRLAPVGATGDMGMMERLRALAQPSMMDSGGPGLAQLAAAFPEVMQLIGGVGPSKYYRGFNPGDPRRIKTGIAAIDSALYATDKASGAKLYGNTIEEILMKPDAKILREGTREWVSTVGRWRKGESLADYSARAITAARNAGYDAAHFNRQTDVGTAIFNEAAIESRKVLK